MFSSNQQLVITGDLEQTGDLEDALRFVIHKHSGDWCADKYRYPNAFQITPDGKYVLGCIYGEPKEGWTRTKLIRRAPTGIYRSAMSAGSPYPRKAMRKSLGLSKISREKAYHCGTNLAPARTGL